MSGYSKSPNLKTLKTLCMTCNHAEHCTYKNRSEGLVWYCEEFDDSGPPGSLTLDKVAEKESSVTAAKEPVSLGICSNCRHLKTCKLSKAICGVWHCEEYE
jgi:hypothetical protein